MGPPVKTFGNQNAPSGRISIHCEMDGKRYIINPEKETRTFRLKTRLSSLAWPHFLSTVLLQLLYWNSQQNTDFFSRIFFWLDLRSREYESTKIRPNFRKQTISKFEVIKNFIEMYSPNQINFENQIFVIFDPTNSSLHILNQKLLCRIKCFGKSLYLADCAAVRSKSEVTLEFIVNIGKNAAQDVFLLTKILPL